MASQLQLAPAAWRYRLDATHQQTRPNQEQPVEAPHLVAGKAGALAPIPDVAGRTRRPGLGACGALVPDGRAASPSIDNAGAGNGRAATRAAAISGGRNTNARESCRDQNRDEERSHDIPPSSGCFRPPAVGSQPREPGIT